GRRVEGGVLCREGGVGVPAGRREGWVGEAIDRGGGLRARGWVGRIALGSNGVGLELGEGATETADAAVCCAGRWSTALLASAGFGVPLVDHEAPGSPALGVLAYTRPARPELGRLLTTPRLNVRPNGGGRL